jgi:hypothetical protein
MAKQKRRRPTTRELQKDMGVIVKEVYNLKHYVNEVLTPFVRSNMNLFEKYLEQSGELEKFIEYIEKEFEDEEKTVNESSEKGPKKQAKGSGTSKTVSKNGHGTGTGSVQQGQGRSST